MQHFERSPIWELLTPLRNLETSRNKILTVSVRKEYSNRILNIVIIQVLYTFNASFNARAASGEATRSLTLIWQSSRIWQSRFEAHSRQSLVAMLGKLRTLCRLCYHTVIMVVTERFRKWTGAASYHRPRYECIAHASGCMDYWGSAPRQPSLEDAKYFTFT